MSAQQPDTAREKACVAVSRNVAVPSLVREAIALGVVNESLRGARRSLNASVAFRVSVWWGPINSAVKAKINRMA
jgi:hypothetical protein